MKFIGLCLNTFFVGALLAIVSFLAAWPGGVKAGLLVAIASPLITAVLVVGIALLPRKTALH